MPPDLAADSSQATGGHLKYQLILQSWPDDSLFRDVLGASSDNHYLETRLKFDSSDGRWDFKADYQFIGIRADSLLLSERLPGLPLPSQSVISDDRRWWNLTYRIGGSDDRTALIHRLDRLSIGLTTERTAWRFGRQAISWGNGMLFTPMDVFNPFDPAAVDKEYKSGDDMLYGQYLFANGDDLQGVAVVRRDPLSGQVEADQSSLAFKYHGFADLNEFDLLAARHYGDSLIGMGGNVSLAGAVWRGDLTWTSSDAQNVFSAVTSLSYSWTWGGKNISGVAEYYYNGFGQAGDDYSGQALLENGALLERLARGELFTLGRHYLALSATVELTPLFLMIPGVFVNVGDPSALAQVVARADLGEDLLLLCALNVPIGPAGSEYGGIESPVEGRYFSSGASLFAQLAWYF